jgi:hypothetical protein
MKTLRILAAACTLFVAGSAMATPLRMDYSTAEISPGSYQYNFLLTLDDHDNSWKPSQSFGWLVFGDGRFASTLPDFKVDPKSLPVGPWASTSRTTGGHNGPNFAFVLNTWLPTSVGDSLQWSGTSSFDVAEGDLLFSTLFGANNPVLADFEIAHKDLGATPSDVPEPASFALLALGAGALAAVRRPRA